ncbi:hypothetical protein O3P69_001801 [Scylla paramamosain]|uniref:Uncharacterized protein n=1 Tax=Scylla paramamosain TaxID=85552 RepID=A0AAW0V3N0_SCYPA
MSANTCLMLMYFSRVNSANSYFLIFFARSLGSDRGQEETTKATKRQPCVALLLLLLAMLWPRQGKKGSAPACIVAPSCSCSSACPCVTAAPQGVLPGNTKWVNTAEWRISGGHTSRFSVPGSLGLLLLGGAAEPHREGVSSVGLASDQEKSWQGKKRKPQQCRLCRGATEDL